LELIGIKPTRCGSDELNGAGLTRAPANSTSPSPAITSPATPATAACDGAAVGFASARGIQRHPPRRPLSSESRRRARSQYREEIELVGGGGSPATKTRVSGVLIWWRRWCSRRAAARGAVAAENGFGGGRRRSFEQRTALRWSARHGDGEDRVGEDRRCLPAGRRPKTT
jgi:hypothetical protein